MTQTSYENTIIAGVRQLPPDRQREVADFVYFLRQREDTDKTYHELLAEDLAVFEDDEFKHLEEEFVDYEQLHPRR